MGFWPSSSWGYVPGHRWRQDFFSNGCSESGTVWGLSGNLSIFPRSRVPLSPNPTQSLLHLSIIPQSSYTPHESLNHPLFNSILCTHHTIFVLQTRSPANNPSNLSTPFTFIRHLHIILLYINIISCPTFPNNDSIPPFVLLISLPCISPLLCLVVGSRFRVESCLG